MPSITMPSALSPSDRQPDLDDLRALLEEQRRFRLEQLRQLARLQIRAVDRNVDPLDSSADNARVEVSAAVAAAARQALDDIEAALDRMEAGRYGYCTDCDAAIPRDRLHAIPQAPLCMRCQQREEHRR